VTQAQAAAGPGQPVAAAFVLGASTAAPTATTASAAVTAIGEAGKARIKSIPQVNSGQDAGATQNTQNTGAATPAASGSGPNETGNAAAADSPTASAAISATADGDAGDAGGLPQTAAPGGSAVPAPSEPGSSFTVDATTRAIASPTGDTLGSAAGSNGASGVNSAGNGAQNFGITIANATAATAPAAPAAPATAAAAVPVAGLAVAIAARAQQGLNQFAIRLDPPELGRIEVHLDVDRNGQVTSHVTVDRPDTLELLQNQQPQLQHALEQAGLKTADNALSFTLRDQSFFGQNSSNDNGSRIPANQAQLVVPDADLPAVHATHAYSRYGLGGGVDIRV